MGGEGRGSPVGTTGRVRFPCFLANVVSVGQCNGLSLCCYHRNGSLLSGGPGETPSVKCKEMSGQTGRVLDPLSWDQL